MTSEAPNSLLSREEVEDYRDKGYLLYRDQLLSDKELDELAAIYDEHRAARPDKRGDEFDTPHFEDQRKLLCQEVDAKNHAARPFSSLEVWQAEFAGATRALKTSRAT